MYFLWDKNVHKTYQNLQQYSQNNKTHSAKCLYQKEKSQINSPNIHFQGQGKEQLMQINNNNNKRAEINETENRKIKIY